MKVYIVYYYPEYEIYEIFDSMDNAIKYKKTLEAENDVLYKFLSIEEREVKQ